MNYRDIFYMLKDNIMIALTITGLLVLLALTFFIFNRKKVAIMDKSHLKQIAIYIVFSFYVLCVLTFTLINRGAYYANMTNFALFSSHIEAWHSFSLRSWQLIYFNILLFVPYGVLLPLVNKRFNHIAPLTLSSFLFTAIIELGQFILKVGIFELDDLFNNILGALIGFGLIKVWQLRKINGKAFMYMIPLLFMIISSSIMFTYYYTKQLGNLSIVPSKKIDMTNIIVTSDIIPSTLKANATIYMAPSVSKDEAKQFAYQLFNRFDVETTNIVTLPYQDKINYRYNGNPSFFITVSLRDHSFSLIDFSSINEQVTLQDEDEHILKQKLDMVDITIPNEAVFKHIDIGQYSWEIELQTVDSLLWNGRLSIQHYSDGTLKRINQHIVSYEKLMDQEIISEQEAFAKLMNGKFKFYGNINHIHIKQLSLSYMLDTKGYYQPIYVFKCLINNIETKISIPALK